MRARIEPSAELLRLAAAQSGVVTSRQAESYGVGRNIQRRLVGSGNWRRLANGVLLTYNVEPAWEVWAWGGVLRAGDGARLAGKAAAFAAGMITEPPELIDVLHPHGLHRPRTERWIFHQERGGRRAPSIGSLPRTRIEDTVLDLAGTQLGGKRLTDPLHWVTLAIEQRLTTTDRLLDALRHRARFAVREEVEEILCCAEEGVESPLEYYYLHDVERAHGLPAGRRQVPDRTDNRRAWRDVYYDEYRVLVELDGQTGHTGEDRFRDFRRDNAALVSGDATLRYGWHDVRRESCGVAVQVAAVLVRRGWQGVLVRCPRCPPNPSG